MKTALLTCDDGFDSLGFKALRELARRMKLKATCIAPDRERSGAGSSRTFGGFFAHRRNGRIVVSGTPVDCVSLGLSAGGRKRFRFPKKFDLVLSGINRGANVGAESCWCSGTLSAAIYAAKCGVPAVAISQDVRGQLQEEYFVDAAVEALKRCGWPRRRGRTCRALNINLPSCAPVGSAVMVLPSRRGGYGGDWEHNKILGDFFDWRQVWVRDCDPNSDVTHLNKGRVTISEKSVYVAFSQAKKP